MSQKNYIFSLEVDNTGEVRFVATIYDEKSPVTTEWSLNYSETDEDANVVIALTVYVNTAVKPLITMPLELI